MKKPREIDFDFRVNHKKLWELELPVEEIPIKELMYNFDIPYLEKEGTDDWDLSIKDLLIDPDDEPTHTKKMKDANLKYPIDLYYYRDNWIILDGVHRLAKSIFLSEKKIKVRRIPKECIKNIKK